MFESCRAHSEPVRVTTSGRPAADCGAGLSTATPVREARTTPIATAASSFERTTGTMVPSLRYAASARSTVGTTFNSGSTPLTCRARSTTAAVPRPRC